MARQFVAKMKGFVSQLADVGKIVDDDELKRYILDGLDDQYTPFVTPINAVPSTTCAEPP
jgi:hypothetical protein